MKSKYLQSASQRINDYIDQSGPIGFMYNSAILPPPHTAFVGIPFFAGYG